eukprot:TRINITY_DN23800_c0_g4_i1.p1 TRINITY_DN23800_c0_g4~~TRINITY_DN23800_c0_g4_i1.p1  ORF type:complete len:606 (+),score=128.52 TRINITY_DN23800_c0_g4_i1:137-1954(+)
MATSSAAAGANDGKTGEKSAGGRFLGVIKGVAVAAGYGFIESREAAAICGTDVFLDKRHARGLAVGQRVSFSLYFSSRGKARARDAAPIEQVGQHQIQTDPALVAESAAPRQECLAEWQRGAAAVRDEEADSRVQLLCSISGQVGALAVLQQTRSNEAATESAAERSRLAAEAAGLCGALKQVAAAADRQMFESACVAEKWKTIEEESAAWSALLSGLVAPFIRPAPLPTPRTRRRALYRQRRRAVERGRRASAAAEVAEARSAAHKVIAEAAAADRQRLEEWCTIGADGVREDESSAWSALIDGFSGAPLPTPQPSGRARRRAQRRRRRRASAAMQIPQRVSALRCGTPDQPQGESGCFQLHTPQVPDGSPEEPTLRSDDVDVQSDVTEECRQPALRMPSGVVPPPLLSVCPEEQAASRSEEDMVVVRPAEATAAAEEAPCTPAEEAILIDHILYWVTVHVPYKSRANWARVCSKTCRASIGVVWMYADLWAWAFHTVGAFRSRGPESPFDVRNFQAVMGPVAAARAEVVQLKKNVNVPGQKVQVNGLMILCDFAIVLYDEMMVKHLELAQQAIMLNNTACDFTEGLEALLEEHSLRTEADDAQ